MATSKPELESVVLHHTLDSIQYLNALRNGTERTFRTFEGTDVSVSRHSNEEGGVKVIITGSGGWEGLHAKLDLENNANTLTQTGVLHTIDSLMIPRSIQITLGKLVRAAGGGTMASLVTRAGMEWILNGTGPPEGSEYAKLGEDVGWTLLVPRDEAWREVNLTALWDDSVAIKNLVTQHLIPTLPSSGDDKGGKKHRGKKPDDKLQAAFKPDENSMPIDMYGSSHVTARSTFSRYGQVSFLDKGDYFVVGITDARGTAGQQDWAKVMTWGRSTVSAGPSGAFGARGGVIKIDRVLQPYTPQWWVRYGPIIAGTVGSLVVMFGIGFTVRWLYLRRESEPTYEPVGRDEEEDG